MGYDWQVIGFTLSVALLSTLAILPLGILTALILARWSWPGKSILETICSLPLVVPPVATGLILLKLLGRNGAIGSLFERLFGIQIVFTWRAVAIAMGVMSFPLLVRAARVAFEQINPRFEQIARTLGAGELRVFFTITLPLAARGLASGVLLAFARALGEFGATILVAGNIPGKTSTLSLSIYNLVQLDQDAAAFRLLSVSVCIAFAATWLSSFLLKKSVR